MEVEEHLGNQQRQLQLLDQRVRVDSVHLEEELRLHQHSDNQHSVQHRHHQRSALQHLVNQLHLPLEAQHSLSLPPLVLHQLHQLLVHLSSQHLEVQPLHLLLVVQDLVLQPHHPPLELLLLAKQL